MADVRRGGGHTIQSRKMNESSESESSMIMSTWEVRFFATVGGCTTPLFEPKTRPRLLLTISAGVVGVVDDAVAVAAASLWLRVVP
jgi:hypothetical protein